MKIISLFKTQLEKSYYDIDEKIEVVFLKRDSMPSGLLGKILWNLKSVKFLRKYFKTNTADIVLASGHNINWLLPIIITGTTKIVACEHIVYNSIPAISKFFMSLTYGYLDHIVLLSDEAKKNYVKYTKTSIIPNALPFKIDDKASLVNKEILVVGRLSNEKGLERLVPIAKLLREEFFDWKINVLGDGSMRKELENLYKIESLDDYIVLKGSTKNVKSAYLNSSIYIMTSHFEAFPMVLLEAQSAGLPIVSYDCPQGPSQIIDDGVNGYLIENGNTIDFAEKLSKLMRNHELRKEFGKAGIEKSKTYKEENIVKKWQELFKKIIHNDIKVL